MSFLTDDFGFFGAREKPSFDFLSLFSFFERVENAFISEFLQEKSLKGDVIDFPLIMGGMGELDLRFAAQNENLYFYDRSEKGSDFCYELNSDHFSHADFDNSVKNFSHMALNGFYNDNTYYISDYSCSDSEKYQTGDSRNDFKRENHKSKCKTDMSDNNREKALQQIPASCGRVLRPFFYSILPSGFFAYGDKASDMGGKVFFSGKNFDREKRNAFCTCAEGGNYFTDGGGWFLDGGSWFLDGVNFFSGSGNYLSDSNNFFGDCGNYLADSGNCFAKWGGGFDNSLSADKALEQFEAACTVNEMSAFDMPVQLVGKGFSHNADLFLQGEYEFALNRENLFAVNIGRELALKRKNQAVKYRDKVFAGKGNELAAYEFWQGEKRLAGGCEPAFVQGDFYAVSIGLLQGEDALSLRQEIVFAGEASHFETAKLLSGKNQAFERPEKNFLFASTAFDGFEAFEILSQAVGGVYCLSRENGKFFGGDVLMRQKEGVFDKSLYLCSEESGEPHISFDDLKKAIGTGAFEYCGKPVKAEIRVDMSGMKNIIYKETSVDHIVADLTAAVSEAVTAAAEGVHIL